MVVKLASLLVVGDYILACAKTQVKGKVIKINSFRHEVANPWNDTSNQNAANWAGAIIRARSAIGSNKKQIVSTLPPSALEARAAAEDVENTYKEQDGTVTITTADRHTYTIPANTECKVIEPETQEQALQRLFA